MQALLKQVRWNHKQNYICVHFIHIYLRLTNQMCDVLKKYRKEESEWNSRGNINNSTNNKKKKQNRDKERTNERTTEGREKKNAPSKMNHRKHSILWKRQMSKCVCFCVSVVRYAYVVFNCKRKFDASDSHKIHKAMTGGVPIYILFLLVLLYTAAIWLAYIQYTHFYCHYSTVIHLHDTCTINFATHKPNSNTIVIIFCIHIHIHTMHVYLIHSEKNCGHSHATNCRRNNDDDESTILNCIIELSLCSFFKLGFQLVSDLFSFTFSKQKSQKFFQFITVKSVVFNWKHQRLHFDSK